MTTENIDEKINVLKRERENIQGTETEVYARIVGYYRSVRNWNRGKKEEFKERVNFTKLAKNKLYSQRISDQNEKIEAQIFTKVSIASISYLYFYQETCSNCSAVSLWLDTIDIEGEKLNVKEQAALDRALQFDVMSTPTVIFFDKNGREILRGSTINELSAISESHTEALGA